LLRRSASRFPLTLRHGKALPLMRRNSVANQENCRTAYRLAAQGRQEDFPLSENTRRQLYKFIHIRAKNTCIPGKTPPLLAVREMTQFPNTLVKEA
jgi:hypothetical protein